MNSQLLLAFLLEDGDAHARLILLEAIREHEASNGPLIREFSFNRFKVILNFAAKEVALLDDLTVGPEGEYKLGLGEFEGALKEAR